MKAHKPAAEAKVDCNRFATKLLHECIDC